VRRRRGWIGRESGEEGTGTVATSPVTTTAKAVMKIFSDREVFYFG